MRGVVLLIARWILLPVLVLLIWYGSDRFLRRVLRRGFLAAAARIPGEEGMPEREAALRRLDTLRRLSMELLRLSLGGAFSLGFLRTLGINLGPLLAGVGVVGLGITLAAQNILKDYLNGFLIIFESQYNVGDVVEINGSGGVVEQLRLRYTSLRQVDGRLIYIPNSAIQTVVNMTKGWSAAKVELGIPHDADLRRAVALLDECAAGLALSRPQDVLEPPSSWGIVDIREKDLLIRTVIKTPPGRQWDVAKELRLRVGESFAEEGIPFSAPRLEVRGISATPPAQCVGEPEKIRP